MFKPSPLLVLTTLLTLLLFHAITSTATIHGSSVGCGGGSSIEDCLDEDFDFIIVSEATQTIDLSTSNSNKPAVDCDRGKSNKSCLPNPYDLKVGEHCYSNGIYTQNRSC